MVFVARDISFSSQSSVEDLSPTSASEQDPRGLLMKRNNQLPDRLPRDKVLTLNIKLRQLPLSSAGNRDEVNNACSSTRMKPALEQI
jgi:hypothetical protein